VSNAGSVTVMVRAHLTRITTTSVLIHLSQTVIFLNHCVSLGLVSYWSPQAVRRG